MRGWFHSCRRLVPGKRYAQRARHYRQTHLSLGLEALEDRCVPSSGFQEANLVSDVPGVAAITDPNLVNPWGIGSVPGGPFWVADNQTGVSTPFGPDGLMAGSGSGPAVVIPTGGGGPVPSSAPTGTVFNGGPGFQFTAGGMSGPALFLFASLDGAISAWSPDVDPGRAVLAVDNSRRGAIYTGLALGSNSSGTFLYAADFGTGTIDVFNQQFRAARLAGSFSDPNLPAGYAPFNVQDVGGRLYVAYALQVGGTYEGAAGPGQGFVDVFDTNGNLVRRLASGGDLNAPWGLTLAPADFGPFGSDLLVGNFGDGRINVYDPTTGAFLGQLQNHEGQPLAIPDLWALNFGQGDGADTLYFSAGIGNEQHGLLGSLQPIEPTGDGMDAGGQGRPGEYALASSEYSADGLDLIERNPELAASGGDRYPLPPAAGPAFEGAVAVTPDALPVALPLKGGAEKSQGALTLSENSSGPAGSGTPAVPAPAPQPAAPGARSLSEVYVNGLSVAPPGGPAPALDLLLSLNSGRETERLASASPEAPGGQAADTTSAAAVSIRWASFEAEEPAGSAGAAWVAGPGEPAPPPVRPEGATRHDRVEAAGGPDWALPLIALVLANGARLASKRAEPPGAGRHLSGGPRPSNP